MKRLLVALFMTIAVTFLGCAGQQQVQELQAIPVDLMVTTYDGTQAIIESDCPIVDWEQPGLMKPSRMAMVDAENGKAYFKLYSGISVSDTTGMEQDFIYLDQKTAIRDVTILINSPGGSAFDGLAMADMIQEYRDKGWTVRAKARGIVASAAVPIFAACRPRSAASGTIFMVHEAALWKWPGRETASDIRSQNELMGMLRTKYLGILVDNSNLTEDEWMILEARTSWFNVAKAAEYGLIDN